MTTFTYPIQLTNGSIALTSDYSRVVPEVIAHILQTKVEERVLNPDFGVSEYTFENAYDLPRMLRSLESSLAAGLAEYPGITFNLVASLDDSGQVPVTCYYQVDELESSITVAL